MSSDQGPPASNLLCPVVKALLNVHITALTQADRMLALTILRQALQVRLKTLMAAHMLPGLHLSKPTVSTCHAHCAMPVHGSHAVGASWLATCLPAQRLGRPW